LLLEDLTELFESESIQLWINHAVPSNDGGISLGQAAMAAFAGDVNKHA
jgi:hydrogenase maturation protein HypF